MVGGGGGGGYILPPILRSHTVEVTEYPPLDTTAMERPHWILQQGENKNAHCLKPLFLARNSAQLTANTKAPKFSTILTPDLVGGFWTLQGCYGNDVKPKAYR